MKEVNVYQEKAKALFESGYNCAQSVFGAFAEDLGLPQETALRLASGFGGGMGRMREVCGAVSGMFMAAGMLYGYSEPQAQAEKAELYRIIQELAAEFRSMNGSIICRELLNLDHASDAPTPEARTEQYYQKRPCPELCYMAAGILARYVQAHPVK